MKTNEQILRDALANLYHELPDILPAGSGARFSETGKWLGDSPYALRGHTSTITCRADDMASVYAAMDAAVAALAATTPESAPADAPLRWVLRTGHGDRYTDKKPEGEFADKWTSLYTHPAPGQDADQVRDAAAALLQYIDDHDWGGIPEGETANRLRALITTSSAAKGAP